MGFLKIKGPAAWSLVRTQPGPLEFILNKKHETGSEAAVKPAQRNRSRVLLQVYPDVIKPQIAGNRNGSIRNTPFSAHFFAVFDCFPIHPTKC